MTLEELKKQLAEDNITQEQYTKLLDAYGLTEQSNSEPEGNEELQKRIEEATKLAAQKEADRVRNEYARKLKEKETELEKLKKEKMTADELKEHETKTQLAEIEQQRREIQSEKNKMHAIKVMKQVGLDNGSESALDMIDFIAQGASDETVIEKRVNDFNSFVQQCVKAQVEAKFKESGRNPNTNSGGTNAVKNPFSKDTFNLTEQGKLFRENPELARQLQAQAKQ